MIRKYYANKVLVLTQFRDTKIMVSRSKLLKSVQIGGGTLKNLKAKGNLVILAKNLCYKNDENCSLPGDDLLLFKKALKNCQKAQIKVLDGDDLRLIKNLFALRRLLIETGGGFKLASLGGVLGNLLNLETIKVGTFCYYSVYSESKKSKKGFFTSLHKLPSLKRVKLMTTSGAIEGARLEREFDKFYQKPHHFEISITIMVDGSLEIEANSNLVKILRAAEYLRVCDSKHHSSDSPLALEKEELKRMKLCNKKNIVKISNYNRWNGEEINVADLLSYCDSLEYLEIIEKSHLIKWKSSSADQQGFRNLKVVLLELQRLYGGCESDESEEGVDEEIDDENRFSSPLFAIFSHIKQKSLSLQRLSLYLSENLESIQDEYFDKTSLFRKNHDRFIEGISTFDKLKTLGLSVNPKDLATLYPVQILSNPGLESFQIKCSREALSSTCDSYFAIENKSQIKELIITVPGVKKVDLFGINLLNFIGKLDNLERVELIDENLEAITFDLFYGFVSSLLEKKGIKRILICTNATNSFYSENFGRALPRDIGTQLDSMLNEMSQGLEKSFNALKDLQLEEVLVGRLKGYSFDYLLYNREMGIVSKLFWTQEEMIKLLSERRELAERYKEVFDLFRRNDHQY